MSALSLEKNGRLSSSKHTKHIKAKYFLIKDYYDAGEVDLRYCPTGRMWADVLTKPLQGQMFRDMQVMMTTSSGNKMSEHTNRRRNKLQLFLHRGSVLEQSNYAGQTE
jgi:hypothetical protein